MKTILKYAATVALTGAIALAAAAPSEARGGRNAAAAVGFGVGAVAGAAIASSAYNNGYYADPGYAYAPGYVDSLCLRCLTMRMSPVLLTARMPTGPAPSDQYCGNRWSSQHNTNNFSIDSQR